MKLRLVAHLYLSWTFRIPGVAFPPVLAVARRWSANRRAFTRGAALEDPAPWSRGRCDMRWRGPAMPPRHRRRRAAAGPAFGETARTTLTASAIKGKTVALGSSFDGRNYGCRSFRDFLDRFPGRVRRAGRSGSDITLGLIR